MLWLAPLAWSPSAILAAFAWGSARTTVYTITNRRVVMRVGIALPVTLNLPFAGSPRPACGCTADGTGDIPLALTGPTIASPT